MSIYNTNFNNEIDIRTNQATFNKVYVKNLNGEYERVLPGGDGPSVDLPYYLNETDIDFGGVVLNSDGIVLGDNDGNEILTAGNIRDDRLMLNAIEQTVDNHETELNDLDNRVGVQYSAILQIKPKTDLLNANGTSLVFKHGESNVGNTFIHGIKAADTNVSTTYSALKKDGSLLLSQNGVEQHANVERLSTLANLHNRTNITTDNIVFKDGTNAVKAIIGSNGVISSPGLDWNNASTYGLLTTTGELHLKSGGTTTSINGYNLSRLNHWLYNCNILRGSYTGFTFPCRFSWLSSTTPTTGLKMLTVDTTNKEVKMSDIPSSGVDIPQEALENMLAAQSVYTAVENEYIEFNNTIKMTALPTTVTASTTKKLMMVDESSGYVSKFSLDNLKTNYIILPTYNNNPSTATLLRNKASDTNFFQMGQTVIPEQEVDFSSLDYTIYIGGNSLNMFPVKKGNIIIDFDNQPLKRDAVANSKPNFPARHVLLLDGDGIGNGTHNVMHWHYQPSKDDVGTYTKMTVGTSLFRKEINATGVFANVYGIKIDIFGNSPVTLKGKLFLTLEKMSDIVNTTAYPVTLG